MQIGQTVKIDKERFTEFRKENVGDIPKYGKGTLNCHPYEWGVIPEIFKITDIKVFKDHTSITWSFGPSIYIPIEFVSDCRKEKLKRILK
jgi:hypothetical protein